MNIYIQYITVAASIGSALGVAFAFYRIGKRTESTSMIEFYQKQVEIYKDMMAKKEEAHAAEIKEKTQYFTSEVNKLTREFGELKGRYEKEKEEREKYEEIAKDKNPETKEFMKLVIKSCEDQTQVNKKVVDALEKISPILSDIFNMVKSENDREIKVESTIKKTP